MKKLFFLSVVLSCSLLGSSQEKFLKITGEVVDRFSEKDRVKDVEIIVTNSKKDTIHIENTRNGKFSFWVPSGEIMDVYFYTKAYLPKYFIVNTQSIPGFYLKETYGIEAEISLTPYDEQIKDFTPFDEPMGYVNFSTGKKVFYWDENYTKEIQRYMNLAYLEQARLGADEWIDTSKVFTYNKKSNHLFVVPSASTFILRNIFEEQNFKLAMDTKDLRKAKLVKEFGIILGGMIDVDKAYYIQFANKEKTQKAEDLMYTATDMKKSNEKELYIIPREPHIFLAENLFFKLGQWMELTYFVIQSKKDQPILQWNIMAHILLAENIDVATYLSDSILSFIADVKTFREKCLEFEKIVQNKKQKAFKDNAKEFNQLVSDFNKLYSRL